MLNMIAASKYVSKKATDCRAVDDGIQSDHSATQMILRKHSIKHVGSVIHKGEIDKDRVKDDERINEAFNDCFEGKWNKYTLYKDFCE